MSHHEPLSSLYSVDWDDVPQHDLKPYLDGIFSEAQTVVGSIPEPPTESSTASGSPGRARSQTTAALLSGDSGPALSSPASANVRRHSQSSAAQALKLRKEWKEVKINTKENPLGISVYKLGSKDGKGAWFARRSVHEGLSFDTWKRGLEREFLETMKVQDGPGSGNIRGIGADRRAEHHVVEGMGEVQVFQLSAQFPGPTSPRDFITLLLTSEHYVAGPEDGPPLRQFMIISKPCNHPDCPQRQGIIRGHYESVELIRELPSTVSPPKRTMSVTNMAAGNVSDPSVAKTSASGETRTGSVGSDDEASSRIEWLMVTRSDPGGSVPRFMVEKGTPPGIVNDAGKFLNWLTAQSGDNKPEQLVSGPEINVVRSVEQPPLNGPPAENQVSPAVAELPSTAVRFRHQQHHRPPQEPVQTGYGLYDMITWAFGAASSVVSGGFIRQFSGEESNTHGQPPEKPSVFHSPPPADDLSDASSIRSFASALEKTITAEAQDSPTGSQSDEPSNSNSNSLPHEKELRKLQERRRKLDEKTARMQEKLESKRQGDKEKDAAALAKVREKHEREIAKQEAKYRREMKKLEEKREQEERKTEERKRKAAEREEKNNLNMELEKVKIERDLALKKVELLESQVGQLQAQNTMLVAKLGRIEGGVNGIAGTLGRSDTGASASSVTSKESGSHRKATPSISN